MHSQHILFANTMYRCVLLQTPHIIYIETASIAISVWLVSLRYAALFKLLIWLSNPKKAP